MLPRIAFSGENGEWRGDALTRVYAENAFDADFRLSEEDILLFVPALFTHSLIAAVPYLMAASFFLAGQGPPLDAARLDIVPSQLWGRAEAVRTFIRSAAQSLAPVAFGTLSQYAFGGGKNGLRVTFGVMLVPLAISAYLLNKARRTYPIDVATAAQAVPPTPGPRNDERP